MSHRIIVVGGNDALVAHLTQAHGRLVKRAPDVDEAVLLHEFSPADAIVLDEPQPATLPASIRQLLAKAGNAAILVTTPKLAPDMEASLLRAGADDVLVGAHPYEVLDARIDRSVRRGRGRRTHLRERGDFVFDMDSSQLSWRGQMLPLSKHESKVVGVLMDAGDRIVTRQGLLAALYFDRGADEPQMKILDVFVSKARTKLRAVTGRDGWIKTVWGRGYQWDDNPPLESVTEYMRSFRWPQKNLPMRKCPPGVTFHGYAHRSKPYQSRLQHGGAVYNLGYFVTPEEAHEAWRAKYRELYGREPEAA